jgi:polysaccharide biosynthesis/export protein
MTQALLTLALVLAQAPEQAPPKAGPPAQPSAPRDPEPATSPDARPAGASGEGYRIGPGDVLHVAVYGHEDLTQTVVVQPGGSFPFPLVGAVQAAGATTEEVEARIARQLAKGYLRDAQVSVAVREYRSQVVYVVGDVARPGTYPLAGETRIVEILSRAGPLAPSAGSEVLIVRPSGQTGRPVLPDEVARPAGPPGAGKASTALASTAEVLHVDVKAIQAGRLDQNLAIRPNDTVFVPPAEQIFVTGEVKNPGAFAFRQGITARQAVALAGGFTVDASTGGARIVRDVGGRSTTLKVKIDERLRPGDTLVIKAAWF